MHEWLSDKRRLRTKKQGDAPANTTVCTRYDDLPALELPGRLVWLSICGDVVERGRFELVLRAGCMPLGLEGGLVAFLVLVRDALRHNEGVV